jgi:putative NIF3 family GTP cyclohydrolase 1 type 2
LADFLALVKEKLGCAGLRYADGGKPVRLVAVGGGSCGSMLEETAATGCDTFVTADVKYDRFLRAKELGLNLIDAGHFNTENTVIPVLRSWLAGAFPGLRLLTSAHGQTERYFV